MDSTLDLLQRAAIRLSQSGSVKDRLADAYATYLDELDAEDLPDSARSEFAAMCTAMHRERPLPRESVIRASVRKMSTDEAGGYAALVVRLFATLARSEAASAATRRKARVNTASPIVQLYAAEG
jgi:hypothetical protein